MSATARIVSAVALVGLAVLVGAILFTGGDDAPSSASDAAVAAAPDVATDIAAGSDTDGATEAVTTVAAPDLPDRGQHPDLVEIDGWLQSGVTSLEELRGQVVAVQFWTFGCSNCKATLPHMQELYTKYHDQGFEIVGIHAPEFGYEAEVDNIVEAAGELGVTWPIVLDTSKRTFHSWQEGTRAFWPRVDLLDRDGHVRYDHIGEGGYSKTDAAVAALLAGVRVAVVFGAFAEAVRATTQPCTLLLIAPILAAVITTRCRWLSLVAALVGAVVGGWVFAANSVALDDVGIRLSAAAVIVVLAAIVLAPRVEKLIWASGVRFQTGVVGAVAFVATLWWRPCVGTELGVILTGARRGLTGELPGMTAYMLGAMAPVALVVLLAETVAPRQSAITAASWGGAMLGVVIAGALVIGRHDELVVALTRLTTG